MTVALATRPTNRVQHRQQTPAPVSPLDRFMTAARAAGCPRDQVRNFLDAKYVPQPVAGQVLEPVGQNSAGNWLQLASGAWIAATLVDGAPPGLPVTAVTVQAAAQAPVENPTALPAAPASGGWSREERGVIFQSECPCDQGDALNCPDFGRPLDGQACYLRCMDLVGYDVHRLDRDKDGSACEWSW